MHSGGISAVAMATPGIRFDLTRRVTPITPARPPNRAISTSQIDGVVRASSSEWACVSGVNQKYKVDASKLMNAAKPKLNSDERINAESFTPAP